MTENQHLDKIIILGIGNTLYQDEGLGIHALPLIEEMLKNAENIEMIDGTTDGMRLLAPVEDTDYLIVIDAINAGKPGGTIITLKGEDIPAYFGIKMSIHQLGFQEVLMAAKIRERYPKNIVMIGMQPSSLELGVELSETNQGKLHELAALVVMQVEDWRSQHEPA
ncbi:HyaD/HybD family hydrogenase maturation endopeptidase [Bacillus benzoevorans]|uniref:Hydrogenase maturation protease n=1 Tax=Bacillus benzoevorans TaxID=1456 RepID=A0A7X0HPI1_9BACI|nr:HyaD/HybD family hydrogenase maturation endopeptidase [Bacillus benzoevorans]MBB6444593.1 hydrogenase maturation protease [Bacillus benzoevorans]